jgi:hypothetical protein
MPFGRDAPRSLDHHNNCRSITMSTSGFQYTAQFLVSIERTVSRERLKRYLAATQQDTVKALELYERNVALGRSFIWIPAWTGGGRQKRYSPCNGTRLQHALLVRSSSFSAVPQRQSESSKTPSRRECVAGKVISELMFGFWTDLAGHAYHWSLWVPHLAKAFPNARVHRRNVHRRLQSIRWLRNRIAHHEPILTSQNRVYAGHQEFITVADLNQCSEWICLDTASWFKTQFRYQQAAAILTAVRGMGLTL